MKVEQLEKCVSDTVLKINTPEMLREFLSFCSNGNIHQMNIENIMATYYQKPDATIVTGFDGWKKTGRFPLQNTGIAVFPDETMGFRQGLQITSLISATPKEEIYGFGA